MSSQKTFQKPVVIPTPEQQKVLLRIAAQRERLHARRSAYLKAQAVRAAAQGEDGGVSAAGPWLARVLALARQHPGAAVVGAVGLAMAAGPRRVMRWAGILLPLLAQLRR